MRVSARRAKAWLTQYYVQRNYALSNPDAEPITPELFVAVDDRVVCTGFVELLGDDSKLVVYVRISAESFMGAILQESGGWWRPVAPPKRITEKEIGQENVLAYLRVLNYLAS